MDTKNFPEQLVSALGKQMKTNFAQGEKAVSIGDSVHIRCLFGTRIAHPQAIVDEVDERYRHREQAVFEVLQREPVVTHHRYDVNCVRSKRSDDSVVTVLVSAQGAVRIVVCAGQQACHVGWLGCQVAPGELVGSAHAFVPSDL